MGGVIVTALRQRVLVFFIMLAVFAGGVLAFMKLNIEAYPDPVPPLVDIIVQSPGQSAEEMERYMTIPVEIQMAGIPNVNAIRTISLFGLSDIKVQFTYDFTYQEAEQWVINRLSQLPPLPNNATPQISPESPIGEIMRYRVVGPPGYSVMDEKTIEDWMLERRFKAVPGVVDVNGWGGKTKTYEVRINQDALVHYGLTLPQVIAALNNANVNVGGQTVDFGDQAAVVRGLGLIDSIHDIANTMLMQNNGSPVFVRDVATVEVGSQPRLGIAGQDSDNDIVQGIVLMRRGAESLPTIKRVEAMIAKINTSNILPPGVHIEKIYDRADLINVTTRTVLHNMAEGMVLIFFIQWIFLGNLRAAFITSATIPFALAFAIALLLLTGESANLLSVGAIDFGLVVDATVIMVENIIRRLSQPPGLRFQRSPVVHRTRAAAELRGRFAVIANAATEVNKGIFFSAAIIIAGFVPLFTMSGIEGHIFGPMAKTYAYAICGGLIATFTVTPALCGLFLHDQENEKDTWLVRMMHRVYEPVLAFAVANRILTMGGLIVLLVFAGFAVRTLGMEFLPKLEEGNMWIRATMPTSISLEAGSPTVNKIRTILKSYPEVITVVSQHGRPDDGTDATGFFNAEFFVPLKPFNEWRPGVDKAGLTDMMTKQLNDEFPGVDFNFSQYIEDNVEEAASGVKGENSIKLFGGDLDLLEKTANKIRDVMATVPGVADLAVLTSLGQPSVLIDVDRVRAARYGLAPGDVNTTIQAAIGGQAAGNLYERGSDRNFPIIVRLAPEYRGSLDAIRRILIGAPNPNGSGSIQIPLTDVATIKLTTGAAFIYREGQERYIPIKFSVRGRDLGTTVLEAQKKVDEAVSLPGGYHLEWVGEFGNLEEAISRLAVVIPIAIVLICMLLYINFASLGDMLLAASVIPMALIGGIFALYATGTAFSVSAAIGFVALFGIAAMDGIIVLTAYNSAIEAGLDRTTAVLRTGQIQMRPVLMTCVVACVGLLPAATSNGIGSQVQKPLALVVVGGILLAPILILVILPVLIDVFSTRAKARDELAALEEPAE
jgi:cobalt-zinc-cadmium resistance protein CzcA